MPTEITQKVLTAAMHIGSGVTHVPGFDIPKVETLLWGQTVTGTVDRQAAHFFRITITQADLDNGVIISCSSTGTSESSLLDNAPNYQSKRENLSNLIQSSFSGLYFSIF